jgi:hypothetical protein
MARFHKNQQFRLNNKSLAYCSQVPKNDSNKQYLENLSRTSLRSVSARYA